MVDISKDPGVDAYLRKLKVSNEVSEWVRWDSITMGERIYDVECKPSGEDPVKTHW